MIVQRLAAAVVSAAVILVSPGQAAYAALARTVAAPAAGRAVVAPTLPTPPRLPSSPAGPLPGSLRVEAVVAAPATAPSQAAPAAAAAAPASAARALDAGAAQLAAARSSESRESVLRRIFTGAAARAQTVDASAATPAPRPTGLGASREPARLSRAAALVGAPLAAAAPLSAAAASGSSWHPVALTLGAAALASAAFWAKPAFKKLSTSFKEIKGNLAWVRGFWKRVDKAGIKTKGPLTAAVFLALGSAALALLPANFIGEIVQNLRSLPDAGAAAAANPYSWHSWAFWAQLLKVPVIATYARLGGTLLGLYTLSAVLSYTFSKIMFTIGNRLMEGLSNIFMAHVIRLPLSWHNARPIGDVISTATDAIYTVQSTSTNVIIQSISKGATALGALIGMIWVCWPLSLGVAPFLALALSIPASIFGNRVSQAYKLFFSVYKPRLTSQISQTAANIETVKSAGTEQRETAMAAHWAHKVYIDGGGAIARVSAPYRALMSGVNDAARVLVIVAAVLFIYFGVGGITVKTATLFFLLATYFRDAVQGLYDTYVQVRQMRGAATRFDAIMNAAQEDYNAAGVKLPAAQGGRAIRFRGVSFGYQKGQRVLEGVDLDIKAGETVALVGESGSGKSTLTRMLLGLLPTQEGSIEIDGVDLKALDKSSFRRKTATILQDPVPFNASFSFNIAYLEPDADEAAIWSASQEAGLHDDIVRLAYNRNLEPSKDAEAAAENALLEKIAAKIKVVDPKKSLFDNLAAGSGAGFEDVVAAAKAAGVHEDVVRLGYASRVGERGVNLSGGQKQRLLLARLFINARAPWDLMILDEPTAALDGVTQKRVQEAIERRRGQSTVVVVAHRLSTIQRADKIVVLNRGRIVEQGSHDELLRRQGAYAKLWQAQRLIEEATGEQAPAPTHDGLVSTLVKEASDWAALKGTVHPEWRVVNDLLRAKLRRGWIKRGVRADIDDTVWNHSIKMREAALAFAKGRPGLDAEKAALMALVHDLAEYRTPDFTPGEIDDDAKRALERKVFDDLVATLGPDSGWIRDLWLEFEEGRTPEAKLVRQLDKIDSAVQALRYERLGYERVVDFYPYARKHITDPDLLRVYDALMASGKTGGDPFEKYLALLAERP